jgi:hypothetical protein
MRFNIIEFSSNQFTYNAADRTFTSEASDLDNRHLQRIYDDACDVGFAIKSDKTGEVVTYVMNSVKKDEEGDVEYWTYHPALESQRKIPSCRDTMVMVFND